MLTSLLKLLRSCASAQGRSVVWTRLRHGRALHQTSVTTASNRYPALFSALAERLPPNAHVLSFGCSTGEELLALRACLPGATIVGIEINARARRIATRRTAADRGLTVVEQLPPGPFDAVLALAVLQREPHRVIEDEMSDLSRHYPFARFDAAVAALVERLHPGGLLAVYHAQYRVEDSSVAESLESLSGCPPLEPPLFDRASRRYDPAPLAASLFVKRPAR